MDDFPAPQNPDRLSRLSSPERKGLSRAYSAFIRSLRYILPLIALVLTVIVVTWQDAGRKIEPSRREDVLPQSDTIQNELLKPVFNSVDAKNQPYTLTADRAVQGRDNPDIVQLENPVAAMTMNSGETLEGDAHKGLYEQKTQKLNLEGRVRLRHSNGYTLETEELRIDLEAQKAYSGRDVLVKGPGGSIDARGLEGDVGGGALIFAGPAKVILYSDGNLLKPKAITQ